MESFPMRGDRESAAKLLVRLHATFGDRLEIEILDPRCTFWIFDLIRFRVKSTEAAWVDLAYRMSLLLERALNLTVDEPDRATA